MVTPSAFVDIDPKAFPFTMAMHDQSTGEILWEVKVEGPCALDIPGFGSFGSERRVMLAMTTPDQHLSVRLADQTRIEV